MSAAVLTSKARPIFLDGNYLTRHADEEGDLAVSAGTALRHRLYDMDRAALWQGDNDDDDVTETITFGLWQPGFQSSHDVDFLAMLGTNLEVFEWDLSDDNGATYPGANQQAITGLAVDYSLTALADTIASDKIKVSLHAAQTEDAFKQIGAIIVGKVLLQPTFGFSRFVRKPQRVNARTAVMADKSIRRTYTFRSDASVGFHDFGCTIAGLSEAEANTMEGILVSNTPFVFIPEPGDRPRNIYLGQAVPGTVHRDYMGLSRGGGEFVAFDFQETGGA